MRPSHTGIAMILPDFAPANPLERRTFAALVIAVTVAFAWILWPFSGAVLWGTALAIVFAPAYRRLVRRMGGRATLAALATMGMIMLIVILPLAVIGTLLVGQAATLYARLQSGELDVGSRVQQVLDALPPWMLDLVNRLGVTNVADLQERLAGLLTGGLRFIGTQAVNVGQFTIGLVLSVFVMLYLLFFLLRDGASLARRIKAAVPLELSLRERLATRFATVIRATIKGTLVVSAVQGALGGIILAVLGIEGAVLWGALMGILALLPAVGPALVWIPIAAYLLATGSVVKGIVLIAFGALVVGLVDNVLRPMLVGRDTRMPDYVVLIATLGGIAVFGINGFIIGPVIAALFMAAWDISTQARLVARDGDADRPAPPPVAASRGGRRGRG
jgi:predicted PurR-regulated permease PerM